jgi:Tfp pilus assembly protein PilX
VFEIELSDWREAALAGGRVKLRNESLRITEFSVRSAARPDGRPEETVDALLEGDDATFIATGVVRDDGASAIVALTRLALV